MTSFLSRNTGLPVSLSGQMQSAQNHHHHHIQPNNSNNSDSVSDIFSDFHNFRNEAKKKAEVGGNSRQVPSSSNSVHDSQQQHSQQQQQQSQKSDNIFAGLSSHGNGSSSSASQGGLLSNQSSRLAALNLNSAQSPTRSFLSGKESSSQAQVVSEGLNSPKNTNLRSSNISSSISSNLDQLRRDIRETSLATDKNFARPRTAQLQQDSPQSRRQNQLISPSSRGGILDQSPGAKKRGSLSISKDSNLLSSRQRGASNNNNNNTFGLNSQADHLHQPPANKLISYSPGKNQQKVFSPNRLLNRLNSSPHTRFTELDFTSKPSSRFPQATSQTPNNLQQSSRSNSLRRSSSSLLSNGLSSLLGGASESKLNTSLSKQKLNVSSNFGGSSSNNNNNNNNNSHQSFFTSSNSAQQISPSQSYVIDRKAQDLSDYLSTLSAADFNSLPKQNVDHLIKLSSVIMQKVKNSTFYKASIF